jgi:hypothetical protein
LSLAKSDFLPSYLQSAPLFNENYANRPITDYSLDIQFRCAVFMLEIAQNFEQMAADFSPAALIGAGLVCVVAGLFIWLGGLGYSRLLALVVGAITVGVCTFFGTGQNIILTVILATVAAVIAIVLKKTFMIVLTAGLVFVLALAVFIYPHLGQSEKSSLINSYRVENETASLSFDQTAKTVKAYAADVYSEIKRACSQMPAYNWAIIALLAVAFAAVGLFLWHLTSALCCAALGTLLIFAGMILLLLYKGAQPISAISQKETFYVTVFIAMTAAGTIEQLLLCRRAGEKSVSKKKTNSNERPDK